jgi:uncharacterized RDD family membrane protein YckC
MDWYYVDGGQQAGPVDDAQLAALASRGKILNDTLVWREGMDNWRMYGEVQAPDPAALAAPPLVTPAAPPFVAGQAVCAECGRIFNVQDMIPYGGIHVCAGCKPVFMQKLAEGAKLDTSALNYAGFWIRVAAKMLDGLILAVPFLPPIFYFAYKSGANQQPGAPQAFGEFQVLQLLFQLFYMVASIGYQVFFVGKYGATLGKMACGLRIVSAEGGKIGYGRATGRAFAEMLSGLVCYIGYIIVAFDDQKRALHDHICNTRVVYK